MFSFTLSHFIEIEKGSYAQTSLRDGYFPRWQIGLSLACTSCWWCCTLYWIFGVKPRRRGEACIFCSRLASFSGRLCSTELQENTILTGRDDGDFHEQVSEQEKDRLVFVWLEIQKTLEYFSSWTVKWRILFVFSVFQLQELARNPLRGKGYSVFGLGCSSGDVENFCVDDDSSSWRFFVFFHDSYPMKTWSVSDIVDFLSRRGTADGR